MSFLNRRHFLQLTGSTFAAIGLNALNITQQSRRYAQVLAQPTSRKLALLVGINAYAPETVGWSPLSGCVTDVQMQEELLVHRFGFNRRDIVTLTDRQATRSGILTAFNDHLIQQVRAGDVVVFHFSGHGSRVIDPTPCQNPLNSSLVPIDSPLPEDYQTEGGAVQDIMGRSLFLLMRALKTDHVTVVLDNCYSGGGKRGTLTIRSRDGADTSTQIYPSPAELSYQEQWRSSLGLSPEDFATQRCAGIARGVVIASARDRELAADVNFGDFHAGAFTYLMTQSLWQETHNASIEQAFVTIAQAASSIALNYAGRSQRPEFEINLPAQLQQFPIYFIAKTAPAAEAIVTSLNSEQVKLWLGSVHPDRLASYDRAIFRAINAQGQLLGKVQTTERNGLEAQGQWIEGTSLTEQPVFLQEDQRSIPENLALQLGLDPSLESDRIAAEQLLTSIPRVQTKPVAAGAVDYIFGRMTAEYRAVLSLPEADHPPVGSIGLFLPGQEILPDSFGQPGELVRQAVDRLRPRFSVLLAARLLRLLVNPGSSQLDVVATLTPMETSAQSTAVPIEIRGKRGAIEDATAEIPVSLAISRDISRFPLETRIQIAVRNSTSQDLYMGILLVEPDGGLVGLFPTDYDAPEAAATVSSGATLRVPDPSRGDRFSLKLAPPTGKHEILVIASPVSISNALQAIRQLAARRGTQRGTPLQGDADFLQLSETLINDLAQSNSNPSPQLDRNNTRYVNSQKLAAFSIPFEVYSVMHP